MAAPEFPRLKICTKEDFDSFRELVKDDNPNFQLVADKKGVRVYMGVDATAAAKRFKIATAFKASLDDVYDVMCDSEYGAKWDEYMIESRRLYRIDPNNDINYYHMRFPTPLSNRDFVNQRSWLLADDKSEFFCLNKSVALKDVAARKGVVRAISYMTGYYGRVVPEGVLFVYVTQSDIRGNIPKFLVNLMTSSGAPSYMVKVAKAVAGYQAWKKKHNPTVKPWRNFEQMAATIPLLLPADFDKMQEAAPQLPQSEVVVERTDDVTQAELELAAKLSMEAEEEAAEK